MTRDAGTTARRLFALAIFTAACVAIFLALLRVAGGFDVGPTRHLEVVVPSAVQLAEGADVKQAGIDIGSVEEVRTLGPTAVVAVAIDEEHGPVHADGRARVRMKTLVGEAYLDLDPGTPAAPEIPEDGRLPLPRATPAVQLDEILSVLDEDRRGRLRRMVDGLGEGVSDGGDEDLNRTLEAIAAVTADATPVWETFAAEREQLATLVDDLGSTFAALGAREADVRRLVRGGRGAARAFAAEAGAVRGTLEELPGTLRAAAATTREVAAVGGRARPVLADLRGVLDDLTPVARRLPRASRRTLAALRELDGVAPDAERLLAALESASPETAATSRALGEVLRDVRPMVAVLEPYGLDAGQMLSVLGAAADERDASGGVARLLSALSTSVVLAQDADTRKAIEALRDLGAVELVSNEGANSYPKPRSWGDPQPFDGKYTVVRRDP